LQPSSQLHEEAQLHFDSVPQVEVAEQLHAWQVQFVLVQEVLLMEALWPDFDVFIILFCLN